jgi:AAA domain
MRPAREKRPRLDELFDAGDTYLSAPDTAALKSGVVQAVHRRTGDPVLLKFWQKTGSEIDQDLSDIWRHEMRQADRVRAFPSADDVVVEVIEHGEASDAFYSAMAGEMTPLDHLSRYSRPNHWLRTLQSRRRRAILWQNAARIGKALGAVHNQGLIHGRLGAAAVFTSGSEQPDFRLGGFEWCVRIAEADMAPIGSIAARRGTPLILSFADDWQALGRLFADLVGLDRATLDDEEVQFKEGLLAFDLDPPEIDLVRWLVSRERHREIDSEVVVNKIDAVLRELGQSSDDAEAYLLALRLGETSKLTACLRSVSGDAFDPDDREAQIEFVRSDLATGAELCRMASGGLVLFTQGLAYSLQAMRSPGASETWQGALCNHAIPRSEFPPGRRTITGLSAHLIEVIPFGAASARLGELRSDALDWHAAFGEKADPHERTAVIRRGLLLAQVAEALFRAAEIIPVDVISSSGQGGERTVGLVPREDEQRARLSEGLRVPGAGQLMRRLFEREQGDVDAKWELSDSGIIGRAGRQNVSLRYLRPVREDNRRTYEFHIDGPRPPAEQLYLRLVDEAGTEGAMRRRLRMLAALTTHQELTLMLVNPRARMRIYRDHLVEDAALEALDASKQQALRSIWSTGPGQFVVGPPGVGKTRLVTEVARRALSSDPSARILLSAQAHKSLDHLARSVQKALAKSGFADDVLLVRSKADEAANLAGAQTPDRVKKYLTDLDDSPLLRKAPLLLRQSISAMKTAAETAAATKTGGNDEAIDAQRQRRSFEAVVLQSANVLFSTTNSGDLSRLVEDRAQFDWVIVEEAAKATGPELLAPLLLSMRRLLIGDHNQLPPFDTDRIVRFLSDQTRVKTAILDSEILIGGVFREFGLDELREAVEDESSLSETCEAARKGLLLFESLVKDELQRQLPGDRQRRTMAMELKEQHRMNPVIATVISECFYKGALATAPDVADWFARNVPPFAFEGGALPASPIVIVDMPYMQRRAGAEERYPAFHNPAEVDALTRVLARLRPRPVSDDSKPSLAILSPYREQTMRIGRAIDDGLSGPLAGLNGFDRPSVAGGFEGTVDSFQGNEADLVVVSLVRNNDHTRGPALGFLRDRRRMNVLLSRARWKLIIITSREFLRVHGRPYSRKLPAGVGEEPYLPTLLSVLDRLESEKLPDGTPKLATVCWEQLRGGIA